MLLPRAQTADWSTGTQVQRPSKAPGDSAQSYDLLPPPRCVQSQPEKACPPGRKPQKVDWQLALYQDWELDACVDAALLEAEMENVNSVPFTHQQLAIFKCKLNQRYPHGYPEALIRRLQYFFLAMAPGDILKWKVTSLETVKSLLGVSKGRKYMSAQVTALIQRYVAGRGQLDPDTVSALGDFAPAYVCSLSPSLLGHVQESVIWEIKEEHLTRCSPLQLQVLYQKALQGFQHLQGTEYKARILPFLGGASTEGLRDLIRHNVTISATTLKQLEPGALKPLTVSEMRSLLGSNLEGLKEQMRERPVWEWIVSKPQSDLDLLGLDLQGGIPNGYLDLYFPEDHEVGDSD